MTARINAIAVIFHILAAYANAQTVANYGVDDFAKVDKIDILAAYTESDVAQLRNEHRDLLEHAMAYGRSRRNLGGLDNIRRAFSAMVVAVVGKWTECIFDGGAVSPAQWALMVGWLATSRTGYGGMA